MNPILKLELLYVDSDLPIKDRDISMVEVDNQATDIQLMLFTFCRFMLKLGIPEDEIVEYVDFDKLMNVQDNLDKKMSVEKGAVNKLKNSAENMEEFKNQLLNNKAMLSRVYDLFLHDVLEEEYE